MEYREAMLEQVKAEVKRQESKWGSNKSERNMNSDTLWAVILGEEVGEVHRAVCDCEMGELHNELIQVAAVAVSWLEALSTRDKVIWEDTTPLAKPALKCPRCGGKLIVCWKGEGVVCLECDYIARKENK